MSDSPIQQVLQAIDSLNAEALLALVAPDVTLTFAYGQGDAVGAEAVGGELATFLAGLRSTKHKVSSEWNPEPGVWIAEMTAEYELTDFSRRGPYRRVMILRAGEHGISQIRFYGMQELPLEEAGHPYTDVRGAHGWLPTL